MNFTLNRKTEGQIDQKRKLKRKTKDICPLSITFKTGKTIDVWDLDEKVILKLVEQNLKEMADCKKANCDKRNELLEIINCWHQKHDVVSADFVEGFYCLRAKYKKFSLTVDKFLFDLVEDRIGAAIACAKNLLNEDTKDITPRRIVEMVKIFDYTENVLGIKPYEVIK